MAIALDSNLRLSQLILNESKWPGAVKFTEGIPVNGWDNTVDNFTTTSGNVTPPNYRVGTKISVYTDNTYCAGNYTMAYLMFHDSSSADISGDFSDGAMFCSHYDGSKAVKYQSDISAVPWYVMTRCYSAGGGDHGSDITSGSPLAIPCATLVGDSSIEHTTGDAQDLGYGDAYGWFWVGGVCPAKDVTLMQGTGGSLAGADISVDDELRKGSVMMNYLTNTLGIVNTDTSNFNDVTTLDEDTVNTNIDLAVGWVCTSSV